MNIKELNKLIKEELDAFFKENEDLDAIEGGDELADLEGGDDIEITTDEPAVSTGEEAIDLLRQIYDLIKPEIEGEDVVDDLEDEEAEVVDDEVEDVSEIVKQTSARDRNRFFILFCF